MKCTKRIILSKFQSQSNYLFWIGTIVLLITILPLSSCDYGSWRFSIESIEHNLDEAGPGMEVFVELTVRNTWETLFYQDNPNPPEIPYPITLTDSSYFAYIKVRDGVSNKIVFADERLLLALHERWNYDNIKTIRFDWNVVDSPEFGPVHTIDPDNLIVHFGIYYQPVLFSPSDLVLTYIAQNLKKSTQERTIGAFFHYTNATVNSDQNGNFSDDPCVGPYENIDPGLLNYLPSPLHGVWRHVGYCQIKSSLLCSLFLTTGYGAAQLHTDTHAYMMVEASVPTTPLYEDEDIDGWWDLDPSAIWPGIFPSSDPQEIYDYLVGNFPPGYFMSLGPFNILGITDVDDTEYCFKITIYGG